MKEPTLHFEVKNAALWTCRKCYEPIHMDQTRKYTKAHAGQEETITILLMICLINCNLRIYLCFLAFKSR